VHNRNKILLLWLESQFIFKFINNNDKGAKNRSCGYRILYVIYSRLKGRGFESHSMLNGDGGESPVLWLWNYNHDSWVQISPNARWKLWWKSGLVVIELYSQLESCGFEFHPMLGGNGFKAPPGSFPESNPGSFDNWKEGK